MANDSTQRKRLFTGAVLLIALVVVGGLLPLASKSSNCGGNSAAMAACSGVGTVLTLIGSDREQSKFELDALTKTERAYFDQVAGVNWLGDSKVLVRPSVDLNSANNVVLAVCDRAFRNVPRKTFGKAPPTHAALIRNRGVVLIAVEDFNRLDLTDYIDVRSLSGIDGFAAETLTSDRQP